MGPKSSQAEISASGSLYERWREIKAARVGRIAQPMSACDDTRAGCHCAFDGLQHLRELALIDDGSKVVFIRRPYPKLASGLEESLSEFIVDGIKNNNPGPGSAPLAGVAER